MVMTTLHTNSAPAAITRLVEIGVEPFLVASSLSLVVAQRLVRRVCQACATPYRPPARVMSLLGLSDADVDAATARRGVGCAECGGTGYYGRTGIFELLPVTTSLREVLMATPTEAAIAAAARRSGMQTLRAHAITKAHAGITTYEEVLRVTQIDHVDGRQCNACGGTVQDDMVACPWCAATIESDSCSGCGGQLEPSWVICPWCRVAMPERGAVSTGRSVATPGEVRPRLLVVDGDEKSHAKIAAAVDGCMDVDAVTTASAALDLVDTVTYDGLVVDQRLPDLAGLELIRLIRCEARTAALPITLLVAAATDTLEIDVLDAGVDGCLVKPLHEEDLVTKLTELVSLSGRIEEPA
jgi:CheY-like chemotaxis protein